MTSRGANEGSDVNASSGKTGEGDMVNASPGKPSDGTDGSSHVPPSAARADVPLDARLLEALQTKTPLLWLNPSLGQPLPDDAPSTTQISEAQARLAQFEPLLAARFDELRSTHGVIESPLMPADALKAHWADTSSKVISEPSGCWFIKRDDALPVAGSIKARGGFHEVLAVSEQIAIENGIIRPGESTLALLTDEARAVFARHTVAVGSTGNLGLSIGVMAAALGFHAVVHMSRDAKDWKKARLRSRGVEVVEHEGDYALAVAAGREQALATPGSHFVDDEHSSLLFLGYAAAARGLAQQLADAGRPVNSAHPLFVYLPCGVGGAPGGITYGLKALFGEHVHCFFAEPTASPCMLVQLAAETSEPLSVYAIGLDNRTEADGLAVAEASALVAPLMRSLLAGVFTVADAQLFADLLAIHNELGIALEPSAVAAARGPQWLMQTPQGQAYRERHAPEGTDPTHVIWATGGSLVPEIEHERYRALARQVAGGI
jgi:D-serine dehydratase